MSGTAYAPPVALPITGEEDAPSAEAKLPSDGPVPPPPKSTAPATTPGVGGATQRPQPGPTTQQPTAPSKGKPSAQGSASSGAPEPMGSAESESDSSNIKSYPTKGGRVVIDMAPTSAELVSSTPAPGWTMQVWEGDQWMRIDFSKGEERVTVSCTWHTGTTETKINNY
ncbi:hypothetical protein ACFWIA_10900 [Streptomyces sp. NPDC127068]|uniref:hypothetical protein n=1 Tax=Streptomyces sp. NPDC127068 TaxID=3347127 RepID=UPI00364B64E3